MISVMLCEIQIMLKFARRFSFSQSFFNISRRYAASSYRQGLFKTRSLRKPKISTDPLKTQVSSESRPFVQGGDCIVCYPPEARNYDGWKDFVHLKASYGTLGCVHKIKEGPNKDKTVIASAQHIFDDGGPMYVYYGETSRLKNERGNQETFYVVRPIACEIFAEDIENDLVLLQIIDEDIWDRGTILSDTVKQIGTVAIAPEDIGGEVYQISSPDVLSTGCMTGVTASMITKFVAFKDADIIEIVSTCGLPGAIHGNSGSTVMLVEGDKAAVCIGILSTGGNIGQQVIPIKYLQKLMGYTQSTELMMANKEKMKIRYEMKPLPMKGTFIPFEKLPPEAVVESNIVCGESNATDDDIEYLVGHMTAIPIDKLPDGTRVYN